MKKPLRWMRDGIGSSPGLGANIYLGLHDLCRYVALGEHALMYEIGSFAGESAEIFAEYFFEVHCVDPWNIEPKEVVTQRSQFIDFTLADVEAAFDERMQAQPRIFKHKGMSLDVALTVPDGSLDFVYIDANHELASVGADIDAWWPKVKPGGFLGGHDYNIPSKDYEVMKAMHLAMERYLWNEVLLFRDTSWCTQKGTNAVQS